MWQDYWGLSEWLFTCWTPLPLHCANKCAYIKLDTNLSTLRMYKRPKHFDHLFVKDPFDHWPFIADLWRCLWSSLILQRVLCVPKAESLACGYFFHSKVRDNTALLRAEKSTRARTDKINTTLWRSERPYMASHVSGPLLTGVISRPHRSVGR